MWVPRVRCDRCRVTHALFPAFVLVGRLDVVETVGEVLEAVVEGSGGVRPAAASVQVPHTTAREWLRRFGSLASELAVAFAALGAELGGDVIVPLPDVERYALAAFRGAWRAISGFPGWLGVGRWRFVCAVTGGRLIATNMKMPYLIVGKRRFMPPVS